jgi:hypothetical protein
VAGTPLHAATPRKSNRSTMLVACSGVRAYPLIYKDGGSIRMRPRRDGFILGLARGWEVESGGLEILTI